MESVTVTLPEGLTKEDIQKLIEKAKKISKKRRFPYIGYSCGKVWIVGGSRYEEAKASAIDKFIEEFNEVLPKDIKKKEVDWCVGVRKLGEEWDTDIKEAIESIHNLHKSKKY